MKRSSSRRLLQGTLTLTSIAGLAACAPAPVEVQPTPAPVSYRPYPPMGAAPNLAIPPVGTDGTRLTINSGISSKQAAWNLRSAYNVAALNCQKAEHASILANYGEFLKLHKVSLSSINRSLDSEFKAKHGRGYIRKREAFQTQVYNYFALPPVMPSFCDATLALGQELRSIPSGQLETYAPTGLAKIEMTFHNFFNSYDQYRRDFALWQTGFEAKYGSPPPDGYFLPGERRIQSQVAPAQAQASSPAP